MTLSTKALTLRSAHSAFTLLLVTCPFLAMADEALPLPPPPPAQGNIIMDTLMMVMMLFFIFYILVIKPQNQKSQAHRQFLEAVKKGDQVVTTGGIIGRVAGVEKDHILLEVAANVRIKFARENVLKLTEQEKEPAPKSSSQQTAA